MIVTWPIISAYRKERTFWDCLDMDDSILLESEGECRMCTWQVLVLP